MKLCVLSLALLLAGCPQTPGPAPVPDVRDTSAQDTAFDANFQASCVQVCANLRAVNCSDGLDPHCVDVCEHGRPVSQLLDQKHLNCLAQASTAEEARACKSVDCK